MNNINNYLLESEVDYQRRQAQVELVSAKVQAIERAPVGQYFLQTLPSHSISLFLIQD